MLCKSVDIAEKTKGLKPILKELIHWEATADNDP